MFWSHPSAFGRRLTEVKKRHMLVVLALVTLGFNSQQGRAAPFDFDITRFLPDFVNSYSVTEQTTFLDLTCSYSVAPTFRAWEIYFKGKFWCPGIVPSITGNSLTLSPDGAVSEATKDFAKKALEWKIFTAEELKIWL